MKTSKNKLEISLTAILVQDKSKGYTAFFAELPNIIAEGDNEKEATVNLFHLVQNVFSHNKEQEVDQISSLNSVHTQSYNLSAVTV